MAKTAAQRQQDKRDRDKQSETERLARLLSRRISLDLYHNDDARLKSLMSRLDITEEQDVVSRLIWAADRMSDESLQEHICTLR
ncbi:hypothetical protein [Pseudomonas moorei]|uniref:Uncharacterized protein n=1 Tax=Pseudomonas moorei TaxID=395599 RepID=A0A1H1FL87_9PSED|nr:hypothetical protein [Pseudomonas moorei]KAB0509636.1 hypothetical protein F7R06_01045 [Pseudomonas moorei]SDR01657.1 hypothetical protein SAMN04490195_2763 [Pseudomonas moorei]